MVAASLAASQGRIHLSGHNLSGSRLTYLSIFHVRSLTYLSIYQEFVRVF